MYMVGLHKWLTCVNINQFFCMYGLIQKKWEDEDLYKNILDLNTFSETSYEHTDTIKKMDVDKWKNFKAMYRSLFGEGLRST